jgi:hypothetical protein
MEEKKTVQIQPSTLTSVRVAMAFITKFRSTRIDGTYTQKLASSSFLSTRFFLG